MVASNVIKAWNTLDNDCQTVLISLSIVGLTRAPPVLGGCTTTRPGDAPLSMVDLTSCPEVGLTFSDKEIGEFSFLGRTIQRYWRHSIGSTVCSSFTCSKWCTSEGNNKIVSFGSLSSLPKSPWYKILLTSKRMVWCTITTATTTSSTRLLSSWPASASITPVTTSSQALEEVCQVTEKSLWLNWGNCNRHEQNYRCWFHGDNAKYNRQQSIILTRQVI